MALVINTNVASLNAQRNLSAPLTSSLQRLSASSRINSAQDDAAGLAIASRLQAQAKVFDDSGRTINDGIALTQTAEGALSQVSDMLQRTRELAMQRDETDPANQDRQAISDEMAELVNQIHQVAQTTSVNGQNLLDGSFQGTRSTVNGVDISVGAIGDVAALVGTKNGTLQNVDDIDKAIQAVSDIRSNIGASQNRVVSAISASPSLNTDSTTSIRDRLTEAAFASETASLTRAQLLQQSGLAQLAQANTLPQQVLAALLR